MVGLHLARILSWSDEDMKSEVAQDLIDLHRVFNIPLFYFPPDDLVLLISKGVEFHLALDKDNNPLPNGCWIYKESARPEEQRQRERYKTGMLLKEPKEIIQDILGHRLCRFAVERKRELC
jgi:hypothetical protein